MRVSVSSPSTLTQQIAIQSRTIGALVMRELHTRFGRDNLGYLWLFLEPALLAIGVAALHLFQVLRLPFGISIIPFYISGYTAFLAFRSIVLRSCNAIEANLSLLYHRNVTLLDIFVARALLDIAAAFAVCIFLLAASYAFGVGNLPDRPLLFMGAWALTFWFSLAMSLCLGAASHIWPVVERFVHPATYFLLPLSGVFVTFGMVPPQFREFLLWIPLPHILELVHQGQFGTLKSPSVSPFYVVVWCTGLTLIGLLALKIARTKVQIR
jgi:capsular polysaccharide transport system permease protein